ncbi:MAG: hypothetical protein D6698_04270 [Gammaproteobacteria bacterium]|nr:MAG: hypothetical protein D6698_04270 [Gammaproteobacteria bacterium]
MIKQRDININLAGGEVIKGLIYLPEEPRGLVVFAHGSGSSRLSRRNLYVARYLAGNAYATLTMDLLTAAEEQVDLITRQYRFDIPLLAKRVAQTLDWVPQVPELASLNIGLYGASTGAAAALIASVIRPDKVKAVVSRGGRPDLAGPYLPEVKAPTLLLVGGYDTQVIELNRKAYEMLGSSQKELVIIPCASHLFEEEGKMDEVAMHTLHWLDKFLVNVEEVRN